MSTWDSNGYIKMNDKLMERVRPQLDHARWHGLSPGGWRVGVTALDPYCPTHRTEHVKELMGLRVTVDPSLSRDEILLVVERG